MNTDISPESDSFISQEVAKGTYPNRRAVIDAAVDLLRRRADALSRIDEGRRQLDSGDCTEYDDDALKRRFDDLKAKAQIQGNGSE